MEPSAGNPINEVLFIPKSEIDMKRIMGMKFPFCIFRNDNMVIMTPSENMQDTPDATITST